MIKQLIDLLIGLFKKDHAKLSAKVLETFDTIREDLRKINESALAKIAKAQQEAAKLLAQAEADTQTVAKNNVVQANVAKFLGESPADEPTTPINLGK